MDTVYTVNTHTYRNLNILRASNLILVFNLSNKLYTLILYEIQLNDFITKSTSHKYRGNENDYSQIIFKYVFSSMLFVRNPIVGL